MSGDRPLATLALSTWNHEAYVERALKAALAQDYSPLEIIVSDDASTDRTMEIVEGVAASYRGPHRLRINRNQRNLGVGAHNDLLLGMAQGEIVVLAAGDDFDQPDRVGAIVAAWQADPAGIRCIASLVRGIDARGAAGQTIRPYATAGNPDAAELARSGGAVLGASLAVHKSLLGTFGPLGEGLRTCEDIVLPFRAALLGKVAVIDRILVNYRQHGASLMGSSGPLASGGRQYRAGFVRMLQGRVRARQIQLADLATARRLELVDEAQRLTLAASLERWRALDQLYLDLLERRGGSLGRLLAAVRARSVGAGEAVRMVLPAVCAGPWFRYQRWRLRRRQRAPAQLRP